jgi:tripartite-type tricarboxylate transporter receptor subunit TctC
MRRIAAVMAALAVLSGWSAAQGPPAAFPAERPLRILTPYGAGGGIDIAARILSSIGPQHVGTRVDVINMPGAGGLNAAMFVRDADPDGYTLLISDYGPLITLPVREKTPYRPTDWVPLVQVTEIAPTFVVRHDFADPTFEGFVAAARARPGRLHATHGAYMSSSHLPLLRLEQLAGMRTNHVPTLGGGETMQFLMASIVSLAVTNSNSIASAVRARRVVPIAVATARRLPDLPETPTLRELGYDVVMPVWYTIFAHANVPDARRRELSRRLTAAYASDEAKALAARARITLAPIGLDEAQAIYAHSVSAVTTTLQGFER